MKDDIINVKGLRHRFGTTIAVDGVTFSVTEGEIFAFLGPNGAGKTTTINVLTTMLSLQEGSVMVAGYDPSREPEAIRKTIGIVFQRQVLDRDLTVWETMKFHGRLYGMPDDLSRRRIDFLLDLMELSDKRETRTKYLSGGLKRRLEIARGLLTEPRVLFLDEPTLGLDPHSRSRIWDYVRKIRDEGMTIFLTTHYMDEADKLSDRICIIDRGKIVKMGTPSRLKSDLGKNMVHLVTRNGFFPMDTIWNFPGITNIRARGNTVTLYLDGDGINELPRILYTLQENRVDIVSMRISQPTMDDVFLHFTGRGIEGDAENAHPHRERGV